MLRCCLLLFILLPASIFAQEIPPILNFSPTDYNAGNQNWMISQDDLGNIYIANNYGLLEYNGEQWDLYPMPNASITRSVLAHEDRVYTGCYMDFGYWQRDEFNVLKYQSILDNSEIEPIEDEQFWNIIAYENYILFQSLNGIYSYNIRTEELERLVLVTGLMKFFRVGDRFLVQVSGQGILELIDGVLQPLGSPEVLSSDEVVSIVENERGLTLLTSRNSLYKYKETRWSLLSKNQVAHNISIYNATPLADGSFMAGTIANGVYQIANDGSVLLHVDQATGLNNNTALSLFQDRAGNVWVGLDNGLSCININSKISRYFDPNGELGTVYTSIKKGEYLYLGTNQGVFYRRDDQVQFQFIEGTSGQAWTLKEVNGMLLCGHNNGTYVIEGSQARLEIDILGAWDFFQIPNTDLLIQGNYSGLYILKMSENGVALRNKLEGFDISSKDFVLWGNRVYVSHEYKGVFELEVNKDFTSISKQTLLSYLPKSIHSDIIRYEDMIIYHSKQGVFTKTEKDADFSKNEYLTTLIDKSQFRSGHMVDLDQDGLWFFTEDFLIQVLKDNLSGAFQAKHIPLLKSARGDKTGYENITALENGDKLLGTSYGYLLFNNKASLTPKQEVRITNITVSRGNNIQQLSIEEPGELPNRLNTISIDYSTPNYYSYGKAQYQHRLIGASDEWSNWSDEASVVYKNLQHGEYRFEVRSRINQVEDTNVAEYGFEIAKPWYLSNYAVGFYIVILGLFVLGVNFFYNWYYKRKRDKALLEKQMALEKENLNKKKELELQRLENEKSLMKFKNDSLNQEIESRNRELAISTMAMIKKNEALNEIKAALLKLNVNKEVSGVTRLIDKNLSSKEDWDTFEKAFNHADKDFFKKLKSIHPELTSGDLRLCMYLRLNLSTKEIAPLLNISPRSVEIKRYRLRKKLDLTTEIDLNEYLIEL